MKHELDSSGVAALVSSRLTAGSGTHAGRVDDGVNGAEQLSGRAHYAQRRRSTCDHSWLGPNRQSQYAALAAHGNAVARRQGPGRGRRRKRRRPVECSRHLGTLRSGDGHLECYGPPEQTARRSHCHAAARRARPGCRGGCYPEPWLSVECATAELYDPVKQTWSLTGSLTAGHSNDTATLLQIGKVLVTGGSAELYDPVTATWNLTGSRITVGDEYTATLLANGQLLVAGGSADADLVFGVFTAELYDPATGKWNLTGNLIGGRPVTPRHFCLTARSLLQAATFRRPRAFFSQKSLICSIPALAAGRKLARSMYEGGFSTPRRCLAMGRCCLREASAGMLRSTSTARSSMTPSAQLGKPLPNSTRRAKGTRQHFWPMARCSSRGARVD